MLETARLLLERWQEQHWLQLQPLATDPEVMRYVSGKPWPDDRIREFVARQIACFARHGFCMWRAIERDQGSMIGFCGLQPLRDSDAIEIGWWLSRAHWGRGLATEAAREVLRDGFERGGLERIVAIARPENRRSTRVMEKLGMRWERNYLYQGVDVVMYAIDSNRSGRSRSRDC